MLGFLDYLRVAKPAEEVEAIRESTPYTRGLRNYASVMAPTGGGPNFSYAVQDPLTAASMGSKIRLVSAKPFPGMEEEKIRQRAKDWKTLSGLDSAEKPSQSLNRGP